MTDERERTRFFLRLAILFFFILWKTVQLWWGRGREEPRRASLKRLTSETFSFIIAITRFTVTVAIVAITRKIAKCWAVTNWATWMIRIVWTASWTMGWTVWWRWSVSRSPATPYCFGAWNRIIRPCHWLFLFFFDILPNNFLVSEFHFNFSYFGIFANLLSNLSKFWSCFRGGGMFEFYHVFSWRCAIHVSSCRLHVAFHLNLLISLQKVRRTNF